MPVPPTLIELMAAILIMIGLYGLLTGQCYADTRLRRSRHPKVLPFRGDGAGEKLMMSLGSVDEAERTVDRPLLAIRLDLGCL